MSRVSGGSEAIVVCNEAHRFLVAEQLFACGMPALQMLEPAVRNTAAAAAVAALACEAEYQVLLVVASGHAIRDLASFGDAVRREDFLACQSEPLHRAEMERTEREAVFPADLG